MMTGTLETDSPYVAEESASSISEPASSVLDLVLMRVRLRAARRAAWLHHLWEDGQPAEGDARLAAALDGRDTPRAEAEWLAHSSSVEKEDRGLARVESHLRGDAGGRLHQLETSFGLSQSDSDLLQTCLALAIDSDLGAVFAYLQGHPARTFATEALACRLFGYGRQTIWSAESALGAWGLVTSAQSAPGESRPLMCDPHILRWLQGTLHIDPALVGSARPVEPRDPLSSWPVAETASFVERAIDRAWAVRLLVYAPAGAGRRTFAAAVAKRFEIPTLAVDTGPFGDDQWPEVYMRAQRLGVLGGMAIVWYGTRVSRPWPEVVAPASLQFVACDENDVLPQCDRVADYRINLPDPTLAERRALWRAKLPEAAAWRSQEVDKLAASFRLSVGDLDAVARRAPDTPRQAALFARELARDRLGDLGRLIECPFVWEDLVVPGKLHEALEDFAFEARDRTAFWESPGARRLFPRGRGLVGLFSGPPGTGKTMAAQIIAADLDLDLFRIDLATVVSKYIGETAKHLQQIFARAARMNAVLLFDEADALFSKRTEVKDAHDRYANADTGYLLQQLEEYRGIVILATNKKQNIDPAFTRRVRYMLEFPRPELAERQRIWRQVISELNDRGTLDRLETTIERLGATVEMSGAQIKNSVLASIFVARRAREPLSMPHLIRGVERELGKEGRSIGVGERERLTRNG